jgi:MFS family permease
MVPLSLLRNRSVSGAAISGFFVHILFGVATTYLPLLYQSRGASALQSGIDILPFMVTSVGLVIIAGLCVKRIGYYKVWIVAGPWIAAVGAGLLTNETFLAKNYLIVCQVIVGAGFGMAFQNTSA